MHLNNFFLKALCQELNASWKDFVLGACFSQQKEELIFHFFKEKEERFIRASLIPSLTFITFPGTFARSKKNNIDLFEAAIHGKILSFDPTPNDRSFSLLLDNGFVFLFKMHGSRSNIIGIDNLGEKSLFRNQLDADESLNAASLSVTLDLGHERFNALEGDLKTFIPTLGKEGTAHLESLGYAAAHPESKWQMLTALLQSFERPSFYVCRWQGKVQLLLFSAGEELQREGSAIQATSVFAQKVSHEFYLRTELGPILHQLRKDLKHTESYLQLSEAKLAELKTGRGYSQLADLLMANLHNISSILEEVVLDNFYTGQQVAIKLKKGLSPQKNAELLYRKAKNQRIEVEKLEEAVKAKQEQKIALENHLLALENKTDIRFIRQYIQTNQLIPEQKQAKENKPYRVFRLGEYEAWVGTNAKNNDELTLKYATKNDLWLHAKDVAGSHVVLKWKAGQNFPKPVIEQAAALAAHFSKRKTDRMCPVIFTPKKYVRKPKGSDPGSVVVDREEVVMVEPGLPD